VVADKTGYPAAMLKMEMNLEADLGIDSIKRVEILGAMREKAPHLPEPDAETLGTLRTLGSIVDALGSATPGAAPDNGHGTNGHATNGHATNGHALVDVTQLLLDVVADKTGYPAAMLKMEMNLEADLGIDSIKRVEILGAMREKAPHLPEPDAETLGTLKTLGSIVSALETSRPFDVASSAPVAEEAVVSPALHRYDLCLVSAPDPGASTLPPVLVLGEIAPARDLAAALRARGVDATTEGDAGTRGAIYVASADASDAEVRDAFLAAKNARLDEGGAFLVVTRLGGDLGARGTDRWAQAGLLGLAKTIAIEHPRARVRAIDAADGVTIDAIADECLRAGPVEIALDGNARRAPRAVPTPGPTAAPTLGAADVVVVSGGARGVTAACVVALARATRARFVLLGRSRIDAEEPTEIRGVEDPKALKAALAPRAATPAALGRMVADVVAAREARANLAAVEAAGGRARYVAVDVMDAAALSNALDDVRVQWGPVTALIHGAGVLHDKKVKDKGLDQWDAVWRTKVDGARALLAATSRDPLRAICLFSSVAARTGNAGQCDYAAANEALNRLAAHEAARRPGCVVRAIGWGPWAGGMVTPGLAKHFAAMGVDLIPLDAGADALVRELTSPGATEVVMGGLLPGAEDGPILRRVHARDYPFLRDHTVAEAPVLPVVLAIEWFASLAREARPGAEVVGIRDLKVLKGITLHDFDGEGDLFELSAAEVAGGLAMELRSPAGPAHYRAVVELGSAGKAPAAPSPAALGTWTDDPATIYRRHLFHGPAFQVLDQVLGVGEDAAEAILRGTRAMGWATNGWSTDPAAKDGALQLAVLWSRQHLGGASLPTAIERVRFFGRAPAGQLRAVLRGRKHDRRRSISDVVLLDERGAVYAELIGVELHALPGGQYPRIAQA
jgi:acyl carrier protein